MMVTMMWNCKKKRSTRINESEHRDQSAAVRMVAGGANLGLDEQTNNNNNI